MAPTVFGVMRRESLLVAACLCAGALVRVGYLAHFGLTFAIGEAPNAAIAFAKTGTLADPFLPGTGPTAHITPLPPLFAGEVYRLLGVRTIAAESVLATWSISLTLLSYYFCYRAFKVLGLGKGYALGALASLCLIPLNIILETVWFRVWDGGMAVALGFLVFWLLASAEKRKSVSLTYVLTAGLLAALVLFISPPIGAALYVVGGVVLLRALPKDRVAAALAALLMVTAIVLTPWTVRNIAVLGRPIVFRDNFGLELANAFYPGAVAEADEQNSYKIRHATIHPYANPEAVRKMLEAGGEVAYSQELGAETEAWIKSNPVASVQIAARHARDLLFPPAWYWTQFSSAGRSTILKLSLFWVMTFAALIEIVMGLRRRSRVHWLLLLMISIPLVPYILVQPTLRYRYIIFAPLAFISALFVQRVVARVTHVRAIGDHAVAGDPLPVPQPF